MAAWTELTYDVMVRPGEGMTRAARSHGWTLGLLAVLAATLSWHLGSAVVWRDLAPSEPAVFVLMLPLRVVLVVMIWIIAATLTHAVARGLKGYGTLSGLFLVTGLSALPFLLLAPISVLASGLPVAGGVLYALALVVLTIWSLALAVKGVRRVYAISAGAAAISILLPWLLLWLVVLGAAVVYFTFWLGLQLATSVAAMSQLL